ncbi:hypothetical protein K0M31_005048 [Melipona bicolor]|uniref:Uncharacterized protein n=1 Tax=Melipona bicolor TaxID=60889 RepID=A0AA40FWI8_9HYME|nr:hypothetical protein K0M31_005048 [Melipona bicolor]
MPSKGSSSLHGSTPRSNSSVNQLMISPTQWKTQIFHDQVEETVSIGSMNRGNFRKVHTGYQCSRTWKVDERKKREREKKRRKKREKERGGGGLSETAAIYETEWKRVLEGVRRPPPLIPPLNTAISTSQLSIRPFRILKGKFQLVRGPTFSRFRLFDEPADNSDGK